MEVLNITVQNLSSTHEQRVIRSSKGGNCGLLFVRKRYLQFGWLERCIRGEIEGAEFTKKSSRATNSYGSFPG